MNKQYMRNVIFALLLLISRDTEMAIAGEEWLGTLHAHQYLWSRQEKVIRDNNAINEARNKTVQEYDYARAPILRNIQAIKNDISRYREELKTEMYIEKGEFEKTSDYILRKTSALGNRNTTLESNIRSLNTRLSEAEYQLSMISKSTERIPQVNAFTDITDPTTDIFYIQVNMNQYDADKEYVSGFSFREIVECKDNNGLKRVYRFQGEIGGLTISPKVAEEARKASDQKVLYCAFRTKPKPLSYKTSYSVPRDWNSIQRDKEAAERGNPVRNAVIGISAYVIAKAVGLEPPTEFAGNVQFGMDENDKNNNKVVKTDDTYSGLVIETGWNGKPSPQILWRWNNAIDKLEVIWGQ